MNEKKKPPITHGFGQAFRSIRRRERFLSPPLPALADKMFDALVAAATAKCVDFNISVNRSRKYRDGEFVYVSGLRGICEDLIYLSYMKKSLKDDKEELTRLLMSRSVAEGIQAQHKFFAANNPYQPVLSPRRDGAENVGVVERQRVREFWSEQGASRRDGPTIRDMAEVIGLINTYEYIYFVASNFVHFNPQSLLKMGWGDQEGPFAFSTANMSNYYKDLASFYGSIIFIGYHSAFPSAFATDCSKEMAAIFGLIEHTQRWPEIVTFEEMNKQPPLYLLTHAMGRAMQEGKPLESGILDEVKNLGTRLGDG